MRKVILDFDIPEDRKEAHEYIAEKLDFPEYYGKNLDALYDCLTDISEPTAVGIFDPSSDFSDIDIDYMMYIEKVKQTFKDAERDNPELCVIFGDIMENEAYDDPEDDDFDPDNEEWIRDILKNENRHDL